MVMNRQSKKPKNIWEFLRECPLVSMILLSVAGYTIYALFGAMSGEFKLKISKDHTIFMSAMIKEKPFTDNNDSSDNPTTQTPTTETDSGIDATDSDATMPAVPSDNQITNGPKPIEPVFATVPLRKARSAYYDDNDRVAQTTPYNYTTVDPDYFNDAAFIGDSRIEGLHDYGSLRINSSADFYYRDGVSIWDLMDKTMSNGETIPNALATKQYKKIFIMCGVNELGTGYAKNYQAQYKKVLDQIQELQPNAIIFINGIMHVTQSYADNSDVYNNDNIDCRNALVSEYADGIRIFYLDMNPSVCDMDNSIPMGVKADYSNDGIHLQAQYYSLWEDFLMQHGVSDDAFTTLQESSK